MKARRTLSLVWLLGVLAIGCAHGGSASHESPRATRSARAAAPELDEQRLILSEGYSLLYRDSTNIARADLLVYAKFESAKVEAIVRSADEFGEKLSADLERIDADYPGVRIDLDPLPEMEVRKRRSIAMDRARDFAPVVGRGGRDYERTILIGLLNGFNHERHLCQVMADEEPDAGLEKFLLDTRAGYDRLHDRIAALLDAEYFSHPAGESGR